MIWPSKDLGILECGCEVNHAMRISKTCPAHRGDGRIELQRFSLDQSATIRGLEQDLRSVRSQLQKAQVVRHRRNLSDRVEAKKTLPPSEIRAGAAYDCGLCNRRHPAGPCGNFS